MGGNESKISTAPEMDNQFGAFRELMRLTLAKVVRANVKHVQAIASAQ